LLPSDDISKWPESIKKHRDAYVDLKAKYVDGHADGVAETDLAKNNPLSLDEEVRLFFFFLFFFFPLAVRRSWSRSPFLFLLP